MNRYFRAKVTLIVSAVLGLLLGLCVALSMLLSAQSLQEEQEADSLQADDTVVESYTDSDSPEN